MMRFYTLLMVAVLFIGAATESSKSKETNINPTVRLWDDGKQTAKEQFSRFYVRLPQQGNGIGVIVCPGGSYGWLGMNVEGEDVARWLNEHGIAAFVLRYRIGTRGNRYPAAIEDLKRAMQIVRQNSSRYGVDADKVGVMGFSAGGHLVGTLAEYFDRNDESDRLYGLAAIDLKPAFTAMIYPVVTMQEPYVHSRSRRYLLGRRPDSVLVERLSLEKNVRQDQSPQFVVCAMDDPSVDPNNAKLYCKALEQKGVAHQFYLYEHSGHGFGVDKRNGANDWTDRFLDWVVKVVDSK